MTRGEEDRGIMRSLAPLLKDTRRSESWPGTTLLGHTARIHTYPLNAQTAALLGSELISLWDMVEPEQPEDFVAYRHGGRAFFVTISHEGAAYFECDENEECELRKELREHKFRLVDANLFDGVLQ